jgi:predicted XRE-type DNA-binding protein
VGHRTVSSGVRSAVLEVNQPKISALMNYRLDGFSVERLMHFLNPLDRDIVRKKRGAMGCLKLF